MNALQLTGQTDIHIKYPNVDNTLCGIHRDMEDDWLAMQSAAKAENISLTIASGFRNFERQLSIWNRKFNGELAIKDINDNVVDISSMAELDIIHAIMLFSALPGASRHHWGCDIDVYDSQALASKNLSLTPWEYSEKGPFATLSRWLKTNSHKYGFYFPYDKYRQGIAEEPWHLSYAPLSQKFEKLLSVEEVAKLIQVTDIKGKAALLNKLPELFTQYIINVGKPD